MSPLILLLAAPYLFTFAGSGLALAPVQKELPHVQNVEVRVTFAPAVWTGRDYENGPGVEELCDATKEALEERFPWAELDIVDDAFAGIYEYRIRGASGLTDLQLRLLGTAQSELSVLMAATPEDFPGEIDLAKELAGAKAYLSGPRKDIAAYNALPAGQGGPAQGLFFAWHTDKDGTRTLTPLFKGAHLLEGPTRVSISRAFESRDQRGRTALGFEFDTTHKKHLEAFIKSHRGKELNVVIGTEILARPTIASELAAGGLITGGAAGFQDGEVEFLLKLLKAPRLPLKLRFLALERT